MLEVNVLPSNYGSLHLLFGYLTPDELFILVLALFHKLLSRLLRILLDNFWVIIVP